MTDSLGALLTRAQRLHGDGQLAEAERGYQAILDREPAHGEANHLLGLVRYQQGQHEAAVTLLSRAVEDHPDHPLYHSNLGLALRAQGAQQQAMACFRRALDLDHRFAQAHYHLGVSYLDRHQYPEAEAAFRSAIDSAPRLREALYNLGVALQRQGRSSEAVDAYRQVLEIEPTYAKALLNLGNELHRQQAWDEALVVYRRLADLDPACAEAQHMTAALQGVTTESCPPEFVAALFDGCAEDYEERLVGRLDYRAPALLRQLICDQRSTPARFDSAVDLGCGTGLMGRELRPFCDRLVGVDLSPKMIARADAGGDYDALVVSDVAAYLRSDHSPFDLIVAADVFSYVGDLSHCFSAVASRCAAGSWFAFTTELSTDEDYVLTRSGRYRHHPRVIEQLAAIHGFRPCVQRRQTLRREGEAQVAGQLHLLQPVG